MSEADRLHREFVDDLCQWRSLLRFREAVRVRKLFQRLVSGKQVLVVYDRRDFGVVNKVEPVEKESREGKLNC